MLNIDSSQINSFINDLNNINIKELKNNYFDYLRNEINISQKLIKEINNRVYSKERRPDWYEWTYRLLNAVRVKEEGDKLIMFMDDEWLEKNKEGYMSRETGYDSSAVLHGSGAGKSYSERVEEGYTFKNIIGTNHTTDATNYFKNAINNIEEEIEKIADGSSPPAKILVPLLKVW